MYIYNTAHLINVKKGCDKNGQLEMKEVIIETSSEKPNSKRELLMNNMKRIPKYSENYVGFVEYFCPVGRKVRIEEREQGMNRGFKLEDIWRI